MIDDATLARAANADEVLPLAPGDPDPEAMAKLTTKQQRFVEEYLVDYNATAAAGRAGYKGDKRNLGIRGYKLIRHPIIGPEIRRRGAATADELGVSSEYLMTKLRGVIDHVTDEDKLKPSSAARTIELASKLRGDLVERQQSEVKVITVQINDVNMEDLR
jgi:phage terminase small subunit